MRQTVAPPRLSADRAKDWRKPIGIGSVALQSEAHWAGL